MLKQRVKAAFSLAIGFFSSVGLIAFLVFPIAVKAQSPSKLEEGQRQDNDRGPKNTNSVFVVRPKPNAMAEASSSVGLTLELIDQLTRCRALASRPSDGGLSIKAMDGGAALLACEPVSRVLASEAEVQYLYARALEASGAKEKALAAYKMGSALGSARAHAALGRMYVQSGQRQQIGLARKALELGYQSGDLVATFRLYELLKEDDPVFAAQLLAQATARGHGPAIQESARLLVAAPEKTELDEAEVEALLLKAIDIGDVAAMSYLGQQWILLPGEDDRRKQAVSFLRRAAAQMDHAAASTLGLLLLSGDIEQTEGDNPRALLEQAGQKGSPQIKAALATLMIREEGLNADKTQVISLFSEAAAAGDAGSASNLGTFYRTGLFVEQDMSLATRWYLIGLALGNEDFSEQIFGYVQWDGRGRSGLILAQKRYLDSLGLLESPVNEIADSALAKAVLRYLAEVDAKEEGRKLVANKNI